MNYNEKILKLEDVKNEYDFLSFLINKFDLIDSYAKPDLMELAYTDYWDSISEYLAWDYDRDYDDYGRDLYQPIPYYKNEDRAYEIARGYYIDNMFEEVEHWVTTYPDEITKDKDYKHVIEILTYPSILDEEEYERLLNNYDKYLEKERNGVNNGKE